MKILERCIQIALRELPKHEEPYKHYSFITRNRQLLGWAKNIRLEPPIHYGFHARGYAPKLHSEINLLVKFRPKPGFCLINLRLNRLGGLRMSKPCERCYEFLSGFGCRYIHYSTSDGTFLKVNCGKLPK